jgi:hypothetical protein
MPGKYCASSSTTAAHDHAASELSQMKGGQHSMLLELCTLLGEGFGHAKKFSP